MFNSIASCITDAAEKLSWTPEMSLHEILPQPRMFVQQFESTVAFEQLQSLANTHRRWQLDKQMDVVSSDVQFINLTTISPSCSVQNPFAINPYSEELHRVSGIFGFPNKVKSVLSERMFPGFKIHFFPPANPTRNPAHAKFANFISRSPTGLLHDNNFPELNFGDGNSSFGFKAEASLPLM